MDIELKILYIALLSRKYRYNKLEYYDDDSINIYLIPICALYPLVCELRPRK
jgi:hypothetical protein